MIENDERPFGLEDFPMQQLKEHKFKSICEGLLETYKKKNADYGDSFSKLFKKRGMSYPLIHFEEKLNRIEALQAKDNDVKGETYIDSLKDLANYAILTLVEIELSKKQLYLQCVFKERFDKDVFH